jgi:hypothetical protein
MAYSIWRCEAPSSVNLETLRRLAEERAWWVAPVGGGPEDWSVSLAALDFLLRDPVRTAVAAGFFGAAAGETLWVAPGESPFAGLLVVGYGNEVPVWDRALETVIDALPTAWPRPPRSVAVLAPAPVRGSVPRPFAAAADRFVSRAARRVPQAERWHWVDLEESDVV